MLRATKLSLLAFLLAGPVLAQDRAVVVSTCGTPPGTYAAGETRPLVQNTSGQLCASGSSSGAPSDAHYYTNQAESGLSAEVVPAANVITFMSAADYAAMRTQLSLTALATTTPGTGIATALGVNVGSAGAPVLFNGAGGTPSSLTLTNATALPNASVTGLGTAALVNTGTSGTTIPLLDGANTFSGAEIFSSTISNTHAPSSGGASSFSITGSITGSSSGNGVNVSRTWNTSGTPAAFKASITNTASAAGARLIDLQVASDSKFDVDVSGNTTTEGTLDIGNATASTLACATGNCTIEGVQISTLSNTQTLTNKTLTAPALTNYISFPASQSASSGANDFDDYEENTWTPTLAFATVGDTSLVYSVNAGTYTKVGRQVTVNFLVTTSTFTHTTAAGALTVNGLPFTVESTSTLNYQCATRTTGLKAATANQWGLQATSNATTLRPFYLSTGVTGTATNVTITEHTTGDAVSISGTCIYFTT